MGGRCSRGEDLVRPEIKVCSIACVVAVVAVGLAVFDIQPWAFWTVVASAVTFGFGLGMLYVNERKP